MAPFPTTVMAAMPASTTAPTNTLAISNFTIGDVQYGDLSEPVKLLVSGPGPVLLPIAFLVIIALIATLAISCAKMKLCRLPLPEGPESPVQASLREIQRPVGSEVQNSPSDGSPTAARGLSKARGS